MLAGYLPINRWFRNKETMGKASDPDHVTLLVTLCAIWYHLYHLKNIKRTTLLKITLLNGCFSRFLNCTNDTKSRKASHLIKVLGWWVTVINMNLRKINSFPIGPDHTAIYFVLLRNLESPRLVVFLSEAFVTWWEFREVSNWLCFSAYSKISASDVIQNSYLYPIFQFQLFRLKFLKSSLEFVNRFYGGVKKPKASFKRLGSYWRRSCLKCSYFLLWTSKLFEVSF